MSAIGSGCAAAEHVAAELRAAEQALGDVADRLQALQPQRQRSRHVLGALAVRRMASPAAAGAISDRRATPPSPDSRRRARAAACRASSMKARYWSASARIEILARSTFCWRASVSSRSSGPSKPSTSTTSAGSSVARSAQASVSNSMSSAFMRAIRAPTGRPPAISAANVAARRAEIERRGGLPRAPSAASARRAASPASCGASAATAAHLVHLAVAVEHHVAAGRERRARALGERAGQRPHRHVVAHQQPVEADRIRESLARTIVAEVVAGATGSIAVNTTCAVMPIGSFASGRNAAKSVASSVARSASTTGQLLVAVGRGAAVAGDVLEHRQHAALHQPCGDRAPRSPRPCRACRRRRGRRSPVGARDRHVGERQAVDVDAERRQIGGDQPRAEPRGFEARRAVAVVEPAVDRRPADRLGQCGGPSRCTRPPS